jgi:hypothetical protein
MSISRRYCVHSVHSALARGAAAAQAEREAYEKNMEEKYTKLLLKNTLDPLLSRLTKVSAAVQTFLFA